MKQSLGLITGMFVILVLASMAALNSGVSAQDSTNNVQHPVGGVVVPTDKLAILAPYLALAGLVAIVSAILVVKKRKA